MQYPKEPNWQSVLSGTTLQIPQHRKSWLLDESSLTEKLIECCQPDEFQVQVISQEWQAPLPSEQALLKMPEAESAFTRQVLLNCDDQHWVFARTLIPASSFEGKARNLSELKSKPLGAVLFSDPDTSRLDMQVAELLPSHHLYELAQQEMSWGNQTLWGRRTLFSYAQKPLLVNEIFLPGIPAGDNL